MFLRMWNDNLPRLTIITVLAASGDMVLAQSSTRQPAPSSGQVIEGSDSRGPVTRVESGSHGRGATVQVAMEGYCPVCLIEMKKWVKGNSAHIVTHDGRAYKFPGEEQRQMFLKNPSKYVPALGGDCSVCYAKMGKRIEGNIRHGVFHRGRVYFFPGADQKQMFKANPDMFAQVDLALGGNCVVCRTEMQKEVPGKPEFAVQHDGIRYWFPSSEQQAMFLRNPTKYKVTGPQGGPDSSVSRDRTSAIGEGTKFRQVSFRGRSGCAACDHGVHPVGAAETLGLAVKADNGKIYVVEDADSLYPNVYHRRFEGMQLSVSGKVIQEDKGIAWVKPDDLRIIPSTGGAG